MKLSKISQKVGVHAGILLVTTSAFISGFTNTFLPNYALGDELPQSNTPAYVAFGDSLTTGSSVPTCVENRKRSPWGCSEKPTAAIPYPDRVAKSLHMTYSDKPNDYAKYSFSNRFDLYRAGIWGYTVQEAASAQTAGHNSEGNWLPQLDAIKQARQLVTGSLGINDLNFSNVSKWVKLYLKPGDDYITPAVAATLQSRTNDFDQLFTALKTARSNGATIILGLYYNPYDSNNSQCSDLETIGNRIVNTLDAELLSRSRADGFKVADFRRSFTGHGAGSPHPYVFGNQCKITSAVVDSLPTWLAGGGGKDAIASGFDPHPNNAGTTAMATAILQEFNNAD